MTLTLDEEITMWDMRADLQRHKIDANMQTSIPASTIVNQQAIAEQRALLFEVLRKEYPQSFDRIRDMAPEDWIDVFRLGAYNWACNYAAQLKASISDGWTLDEAMQIAAASTFFQIKGGEDRPPLLSPPSPNLSYTIPWYPHHPQSESWNRYFSDAKDEFQTRLRQYRLQVDQLSENIEYPEKAEKPQQDLAWLAWRLVDGLDSPAIAERYAEKGMGVIGDDAVRKGIDRVLRRLGLSPL